MCSVWLKEKVSMSMLKEYKTLNGPQLQEECASLTFVNYSAFLLGGLNYDVSKDIA